ncbi:hypothetical protein O3S80_02680 [Streptomyces sp. Lzd4kr]|nr:hypothetical protein [Streptomyces sp. Lzd4kr]
MAQKPVERRNDGDSDSRTFGEFSRAQHKNDDLEQAEEGRDYAEYLEKLEKVRLLKAPRKKGRSDLKSQWDRLTSPLAKAASFLPRRGFWQVELEGRVNPHASNSESRSALGSAKHPSTQSAFEKQSNRGFKNGGSGWDDDAFDVSPTSSHEFLAAPEGPATSSEVQRPSEVKQGIELPRAVPSGSQGEARTLSKSKTQESVNKILLQDEEAIKKYHATAVEPKNSSIAKVASSESPGVQDNTGRSEVSDKTHSFNSVASNPRQRVRGR